MPGQGMEGKVRRERAERGLLTVFKAIALKITQASVLKPLCHHAAPQDGSITWNHQVAKEGENQGRLHLLQTPDSSGRQRPGEWVESQIISTKIPGTLVPLKEEKGAVGVGSASQCVQKNGSPAWLNHDTSSHPFSVLSYCKPKTPEATSPPLLDLFSKEIALLKVSFPHTPILSLQQSPMASSWFFLSHISLSH